MRSAKGNVYEPRTPATPRYDFGAEAATTPRGGLLTPVLSLAAL